MFLDSFLKKLEKNNVPIHASFELTWKCNTKCLHCYQNSPKEGELDIEEIKNILDQMTDMGCFFLTLTGGEPLMRKDFLEIAQYAKNKGFALQLKTNGTLIEACMAKKIKELNFLEVDISIYGSNAKTHDSISQSPGSFEKIKSAVKLLRAENIRVRFMLTLMKQNFKELDEIKNLSKELGAELFYSPQVYTKHDKDKKPLDYRLTDKDLKGLYVQDRKKEVLNLGEIGGLSAICQFGRTACTISPLGDVYPCVGVPISAGNLRKESFKHIWQNSEVLKSVRSLNNSKLKECLDCKVSNYCFRCPGAALLEEGNINFAHKEACRQARIKEEVLR